MTDASYPIIDLDTNPNGHTIAGIAPIVTDTGVRYTAWTDGYAVGFRAEHTDGRVEFIYLNPSMDSDDEDNTPNVFLYHGSLGSAYPAQADTVCYVDVFQPAE